MAQATIPVIVALAMSLLTCCERIAAADQSASGGAVIDYRSQTDLFRTGQGTTPFLVEQAVPNQTSPAQRPLSQTAAKPSLTLMSLAPVGLQADRTPLTKEAEEPADASEFQSLSQPSITDLADTLQWTILLLTAVAAGVIGVHRLTKHKQKTQSSHRMEYQGCLPVRGQFSMHLVTIIDRQFLVTTDRSGVKTVNALSEWDQFTAPIDPSVDDQFPELSIESMPRHHG